MSKSRLTLLPSAAAPQKVEMSADPVKSRVLQTSVDETQTVDVTSITLFAKGDRWRTEAMRSYDRPVLIWFTRGQGRITIAGRTGGYGSHSAIYLPAGTMHGFTVTSSVLGSVLRLTNKSAQIMPNEPCHFRVREVHQHRALTGLVDNIDNEARQSDGLRNQALAYHEGLLAVWFARYAEAHAARDARQTAGSAAQRLTEAYTALVERDYRQPVGVQHFAGRLGVTPTHLSRACREASGRAALEILKERRYFEACRLLKDTDIPISQIAKRTGFTSAAYFTRAFRSAAGTSPSEFRAAK